MEIRKRELNIKFSNFKIMYEHLEKKIEYLVFYIQYSPKFLHYLVMNREKLWKTFMRDYIESLKINVYVLHNKRLNQKYGNFEKDHPLYGGVIKAMEITDSMKGEILKDPSKFQKMVNDRAKQFSHHAVPPTEDKMNELKIDELKEKYMGKGLGEITGFVKEYGRK
jgi:hypothetical protein